MTHVFRTIAVSAAPAAAALLAVPAAAATPPPPVAALRAAAVYDHTVVLRFLVPAAFYDPGAGGVVMMTLGRTGPATPDSGYPAAYPPLTTSPTFVTRRDLKANTTYTFGVWVRDGGRYSAPRYVTVTTRRDVTPPAPVSHLQAAPSLSAGLVPGVYLRWYGSPSADATTVHVVRTTTTWAGRTTVTDGLGGGGGGLLDTSAALRRDVTYHYYVAARDTAGLLSSYTRVDVATNLRRIGGANDPTKVTVFDAGAAVVAEPVPSLPPLAGRYFTPSAGHWAMNVAPGRYTACAYAPTPDPGQHMQYISGCWGTGINPGGATYDWDENPADFPATARQAVDARSGDVATGVDVQLVIS